MAESIIERLPTFAEGVRAVLDRWTVLRLAVEQRWGGDDAAEKCQLTILSILDLFAEEGDSVVPDQVAELLDTILSTQFDCSAEDGSLEAISQHVVKLYREAKAGKNDLLSFILGQPVPDLSGCPSEEVVVEGDPNELEEDESVGDSEEDKEMKTDEDGFTEVKIGKHGRRRQ